MEEFKDASRNQINIAIIGPTSVGKSTLLNTLFVNTYSDMKKKRTTMTPQVYYESKDPCKFIDNIKSKNKEINDKLTLKTEKELKLTEEDIKECIYLVPKVHKLVDLMKEVYLTVYDIPGLDDSRTDIYFQYMQKNFYKFDIIIFVIDIETAFNNNEQIKILTSIITNIKQNKDLFNVDTSLLILTNKCDDLQFEDGKYKFLDEELEEMFQQAKLTVEQKVKELHSETNYYIHPISAEDSYIYRMYEKNPKYELDIKHINKFGFNEYGKSRWNRLKDVAKKSKIKELLSKMNISENLKHTGFFGLQKYLSKLLTKKNQFIYIRNHIVYGLKLINKNNTIDITEDINQFYLYFKRFGELNKYYSKELDNSYANLDIFNEHIKKYLEGYNKNIIEKYISGNTEIEYQPINDSNIIQIDQMHNIFKELYRLFNGHCPIITLLNSKIISALNNYYSKKIINKSNTINDTFEFLYKLIVNKFQITKDLISNIFKNNDIKKKTPKEIMKYLNDLESKKLINLEDKINYLNDLTIRNYLDIDKGIFSGQLNQSNINIYCYYVELIWNKFVNQNLDLCFFGKYKQFINQINYYSKSNLKHIQNKSFQTNNINIQIDLELYLISLYGQYYNITFNTQIFKKIQFKKKKDKKQIEIDDGNISDDLDKELGLSSNC